MPRGKGASMYVAIRDKRGQGGKGHREGARARQRGGAQTLAPPRPTRTGCLHACGNAGQVERGASSPAPGTLPHASGQAPAGGWPVSHAACGCLPLALNSAPRSPTPHPTPPRPPTFPMPGLGIPLATLDEQPKLDVAIDGADEVRRRQAPPNGRRSTSVPLASRGPLLWGKAAAG